MTTEATLTSKIQALQQRLYDLGTGVRRLDPRNDSLGAAAAAFHLAADARVLADQLEAFGREARE